MTPAHRGRAASGQASNSLIYADSRDVDEKRSYIAMSD